MSKQKKLYFIVSLFLTFICSLPGYAADSNSCKSHPAMVEVTHTIDNILKELESNKSEIKSSPKVVYGIIDRLMVPKADFDVMSQLVLTRNWGKMNAEQQKAFTKEVARLIIRTYGVAFESYDGETVEYLCPVKKLPGNASRVEISTVIHSIKRPDSVVKFRVLGRSDACKTCNATIDSCKATGKKCKELQKGGDAKELESCKNDYDACRKDAASCKESCTKCQECEKGQSSDCQNCNVQWLAYDLIIDNISIIESYRNIFADKFRREKNIDKIISDMQSRQKM